MRLRAVAWRRMCAVSRISTMKVDSPRARLSPAPTRVKIAIAEADARGARGHEAAHLRQDHGSATWRISVDLPAMLGPRDDQDLLGGGIEADVVGDEAAGRREALDDRVAAVGEIDHARRRRRRGRQ